MCPGHEILAHTNKQKVYKHHFVLFYSLYNNILPQLTAFYILHFSTRGTLIKSTSQSTILWEQKFGIYISFI